MPVDQIWQAWCNRGECAWHEEYANRHSANNAMGLHLNSAHRKQEVPK